MKTLSRSNIIITLIIITFFIQVMISKELWFPSVREFPLIPFFSWFPLSLGREIDLILLIVMAASLPLLLFIPEKKLLLLLFIIPGAFLVLEDVTRLQPWFYLYLTMLLILSFEDKLTTEKTVYFLQWILLAVYFFSGFNKLNIAFAWEVFPWFTTPIGIGESFHLGFDNLNKFPLPLENYIAYFIPVFEICIAIFLFFRKTRWIGIIFCLATHLFSLYAIGPWGYDWNQIVWPWNFLMPILCWLLFFENKPEDYLSEQWKLIKTKWGVTVITLFFIFPLLGFWGYWDKGVSFHLYSGNANEMEFYFSGYDENLANSSLSKHLYYNSNTNLSLMRVEPWVIEELGSPMYGTPRHMKKIGVYLCGCLENPENGGIRIYERNGFYSRQDTMIIPCKDLN